MSIIHIFRHYLWLMDASSVNHLIDFLGIFGTLLVVSRDILNYKIIKIAYIKIY